MQKKNLTKAQKTWLMRERDCSQGHDFEIFCSEVLRSSVVYNGHPIKILDRFGSAKDKEQGTDSEVEGVHVDWTLHRDIKFSTTWLSKTVLLRKNGQACAWLSVGARTGNTRQKFRKPVMVFAVEYDELDIKYPQLKSILIDMLPGMYAYALKRYRAWYKANA